MNIKDLKKYEPIYVIGHRLPDIDTAVSSVLVSKILNSYGIESYYAILNVDYEYDEYNKTLINDCMDYNPVVIDIKDIKNYNFFLTDHNNPDQSVTSEANVVGCIDHHIDSGKVKNILLSNMCSVSLFIYDYFKNEYNFTEEEKKQVFYAFLDDSSYGMSSRYKESDGVVASTLGFGNDYKTYFKKYFIPTDTTDINKAILNGYKKFTIRNITFESGYIESFGTDKLNEYKELINQKEAFLGRWVDYENNKTYAIFKYDNKMYEQEYNFIASRATTIMNDVIWYLKENNYIQE